MQALSEGIVEFHQTAQAVDAGPIGHGLTHLAQHPWAVIHETPICFDRRSAESPPLSQTIREMARNHFTNDMVVG